MATTNISLNTLFEWGAKKIMVGDDVRQNQILRVTKYNLMVHTFNASTVLLVAAVAAVVLLSMQAALVLGAISLFCRFGVEKEFHRIAMPQNVENIGQIGVNVLNALGFGRVDNIAGLHILNQIGAKVEENWHADRLIVADYSLWKNSAPVPEAR